MSRSHIYETLSIGYPGESVTHTAKVIKAEYASFEVWQKLLTPEEKAKYDSLMPVEQLMVAMSCNPFRALGAEE